jgi:hypothetical protein
MSRSNPIFGFTFLQQAVTNYEVLDTLVEITLLTAPSLNNIYTYFLSGRLASVERPPDKNTQSKEFFFVIWAV